MDVSAIYFSNMILIVYVFLKNNLNCNRQSVPFGTSGDLYIFAGYLQEQEPEESNSGLKA